MPCSARSQRSDGYFSASGSKTVAVSVDRLVNAFADESIRVQWLPDIKIQVRMANAPKSLRADWHDGSTRIVVSFTPKGDTKAQVGLDHEKLVDADTAVQMKAFWRERLTVLKQLLET